LDIPPCRAQTPAPQTRDRIPDRCTQKSALLNSQDTLTSDSPFKMKVWGHRKPKNQFSTRAAACTEAIFRPSAASFFPGACPCYPLNPASWRLSPARASSAIATGKPTAKALSRF
jgi:hypothetical protein